jgi:hypothetical protein
MATVADGCNQAGLRRVESAAQFHAWFTARPSATLVRHAFRLSDRRAQLQWISTPRAAADHALRPSRERAWHFAL